MTALSDQVQIEIRPHDYDKRSYRRGLQSLQAALRHQGRGATEIEVGSQRPGDDALTPQCGRRRRHRAGGGVALVRAAKASRQAQACERGPEGWHQHIRKGAHVLATRMIAPTLSKTCGCCRQILETPTYSFGYNAQTGDYYLTSQASPIREVVRKPLRVRARSQDSDSRRAIVAERPKKEASHAPMPCGNGRHGLLLHTPARITTKRVLANAVDGPIFQIRTKSNLRPTGRRLLYTLEPSTFSCP